VVVVFVSSAASKLCISSAFASAAETPAAMSFSFRTVVKAVSLVAVAAAMLVIDATLDCATDNMKATDQVPPNFLRAA